LTLREIKINCGSAETVKGIEWDGLTERIDSLKPTQKSRYDELKMCTFYTFK